MNRTRLTQALLVAALGSAALIGCRKKEEPAPAPPPAAVEPAPAPVLQAPAPTASVTGVVLGNSETATASATTLAPSDKTIYAIVSTQTSDPAATVPGKLTATWTHLDSNQTVSEDARDLAFAGPGTTVFQINKPDGWPTGKYRLTVALDGNTVNTTDFEVK